MLAYEVVLFFLKQLFKIQLLGHLIFRVLSGSKGWEKRGWFPPSKFNMDTPK